MAKLSGYLLERFTTMTGAYTANALVAAADRKGMDLRIIGLADLVMSDGRLWHAGEHLGPRDFVLNRVKRGHLRGPVNELGTRSYNALDPFSRYISKYWQKLDLSTSHTINAPWFLATAHVSLAELEARLGLPVVAKGLESSRGREVFLIKNEADLRELVARFGSTKEWLFEEFIATSVGRDMRLFAIRGEVVAAIERRSDSDFRANVALGSNTRPLEVTEEFTTIGRELYTQTGLDIMGIDLLYGNDEPYLTEVNVMPGTEGVEAATRVDISGLVMDMVAHDLGGTR